MDIIDDFILGDEISTIPGGIRWEIMSMAMQAIREYGSIYGTGLGLAASRGPGTGAQKVF